MRRVWLSWHVQKQQLVNEHRRRFCRSKIIVVSNTPNSLSAYKVPNLIILIKTVLVSIHPCPSPSTVSPLELEQDEQ
jgi:hypothetical protein